MFTPYEIAKLTDDLEGVNNIKAINKIFRKQDESHLWPISGRFNVTNRAIRKARKFDPCYGLEYCLLIDHIISEAVNHG